MDAHASSVALSRHRDGTELHYGLNDFANADRLVRNLSRDRAKDVASDYDHAERATPSSMDSPENRPFPDRPLAVYYLPQDCRRNVPGAAQNQR
jgi:hypothetical protein